jgi:hypothetical protein
MVVATKPLSVRGITGVDTQFRPFFQIGCQMLPDPINSVETSTSV